MASMALAEKPALGWLRRMAALAAPLGLVLLAYLSLKPSTDADPFLLLLPDKVLHMVAYFVLAAAWRLGYPHLRWWMIAGGLVACGIGLEIVQGLLPWERTPSVIDAASNLVGVACGIFGAAPFKQMMLVPDAQSDMAR
ncbi:MAG: hypothetical protein AAGJ32_08060 [Pseudomonadota bacterium]